MLRDQGCAFGSEPSLVATEPSIRTTAPAGAESARSGNLGWCGGGLVGRLGERYRMVCLGSEWLVARSQVLVAVPT